MVRVIDHDGDSVDDDPASIVGVHSERVDTIRGYQQARLGFQCVARGTRRESDFPRVVPRFTVSVVVEGGGEEDVRGSDSRVTGGQGKDQVR